MTTLQKYYPFFVSALLMGMVLLIIYPHYQYYIDPDGTAYLTISGRYAAGDIQHAINGYWSPWACWLTALLIKCGIAAIPASVFVNALAATGFLYISQSFFLKFEMAGKMQWMLCITLAFFLCYAIFWQSFDDLWECFFLLCALRLMLHPDYKSKPVFWALSGIIGALAYFAKAYSFPFFILNTTCCAWLIAKGNKRLWLKMSFTAIGAMLLISAPWILMLHAKYGIWTTSTAGALNTSWYLEGHPHWKAGLGMLVPPPYAGSPYYWEDPWFANGVTPHFWDSWHLAGLQLLRLGYNMIKLMGSMLQLSVFFPFITGAVILMMLKQKTSLFFTNDRKIVLFSFLLFPLGYLLINFESRYIWYMVPLCMLTGQGQLQSIPGKWHKVLTVLFPLSFLAWPAYEMAKMYNEGKAEYRLSKELKRLDVQGSFTNNCTPGIATQRTVRLAYFSGLSFYAHPGGGGRGELLPEIRKYKIRYYLSGSFFTGNGGDSLLTDESGRPFPLVAGVHWKNIQVQQIDSPAGGAP